MVLDAKDTFDKRCDALARPDIASKAPGLSAFAEQGWKVSTLSEGQAKRCTGRRARAKRFSAASTSTSHPLADSTRSDTEGGGNLIVFPAELVQFPSTQAPTLTPVDWL